MANKGSTSYGLGYILNVILAIIPITNIIFGIIIRAKSGNLIGLILNIFLCPLFFIIDLISVILRNKLTFLV